MQNLKEPAISGKTAIGIIGGGAFGTALATSFSKKGLPVLLWARSSEIVDEISTYKTNRHYTGNFLLPKNIDATCNLDELFDSCGVWLYACPSPHVREFMQFALRAVTKRRGAATFINTAKGLEPVSLKFHNEIAEELWGQEFGRRCYMSLSGPSFASEILTGVPTCLSLSGHPTSSLKEVQQLIASESLRPYTTTDLIGCQLGGAIKNVLAIASGAVDGMKLGHNTQAAFINLGLSEMARLGVCLGARTETFLGFSGIGDLILTCTSPLSRNRSFGSGLGRGLTVAHALEQAGKTVEGYQAAPSIRALIEKTGALAPICLETYDVLYNGKPVAVAIQELLSRPAGVEWA